MLLKEITATLEDIAPTQFAESWDNVGLLVGDPQADVSSAVLCIDCTPAVYDEAVAAGAGLIIAYHPLIFDPLNRVTAGSLVYRAIRDGVAIYSPHTALDVAAGGTNDMLADALGLVTRRALKPLEPASDQLKFVTFIPEQYVEPLSKAMFDAGAGVIGDYTWCSFRTPGKGTFFGNENTNPTVGQAGQLETADEIRLEMLIPKRQLREVMDAMYRAHPYEEPAFDLVELAAPPTDRGMGRIGEMPPITLPQLITRIKEQLSLRHLLVAGQSNAELTKAACCAGACGKLMNDAIAQKAQVYLTGEVRHHDALKAAANDMTVICTLHSNSERAILKRVADKLTGQHKELKAVLSAQDADPFLVL